MRQETRIKYLKDRFLKKFNVEANDVFISPGRIELLGNHTDHNNGKVLVSSIDLNILAVCSPREDNKIVFYSKGYKKMELSLTRLKVREDEYSTSIALIRGVAFKMRELGYKIGGFSVYSDSSVPRGAGVSSSAAFEVLIAKILNYYYNDNQIKTLDLIKIAQFAETVYFNKPCGMLDQSGIALGGINYIDFENNNFPIMKNIKVKIKDYQFIIINTGDDHSKLTPCYAKIKNDMKSISNFFNKEVLREVSEDEFVYKKDQIIKNFGNEAYLRAKHFFEENHRVQNAYEALLKKDYVKFFEMIDQSGHSSYYQLKNCYVNNEDENLPRALKKVKEIDPECYSRVHGGGFAGTMLMIIKKEKLKKILPLLQNTFGRHNVMKVSLVEYGTSLIQFNSNKKLYI